jgi:hypothetical protein
MCRLTLDIGLSATSNVFMDRLVQWQRDGRVELIEALPPRKKNEADSRVPARRKSYFTPSQSRSTPIAGSGKVTFLGLAGILFPGRDPAKLHMTELNDIILLIRHHSIRNDIFVTENTKSYIDDGHQESLKSAYGILAMTPEQAVRNLVEFEHTGAVG